MARILLLSLVFAPDGVSTAVLVTELALELQRLGHQVEVLTTTPHYNVDLDARARQPLQPCRFHLVYQSQVEQILVHHVAIPTKGHRIGARMLDYLRFHAVSLVMGVQCTGSYDVILAPSPPLTIGIVAWLLGLAGHAPFIYNVQEIYPDVAVSLGVLKNPALIRGFEWLERFIYGHSRRITVISERFRRCLLAKGVAADKLQVIPNFVDTEFMQPGSRCNPFAREHGLEDKFVVQYAGNIGLTQGFETIFEAARMLQPISDLRFLIVGDGTRREWLEAQLAEHRLPNVLLLPYQPRSLVPQIYASSDICLVPLKRGTAQETFPSKIYTIMAAGRPVIASADPDSELEWVVQQAGCGWTTPPDNAAVLAETIRLAYAERQQLAGMGRRGRDYVVAHHSKIAVAEQYDSVIRSLLGPQILANKPCPNS